MPSAAARRLYEDQIPSFMSVFHLDAETMADRDLVTVVDPKLVEIEPTCANPSQQRLRPDALPSDPSHRHNDSTSTQNTESADSSPTTTMSTTDSASLSDPSPSSSPDSPVNLMPLSSFTNTTPFSALSTMSSANLPPPDTSNLERPMTSPSPRRPRNMKGLSIQPPFSGSLDTNLVSEPSSPSFIKPKIPAMKRKPSQLSLKTNSTDLNLCRPTLEVPQSPGMPPILQRRALKHSTSSPHMLSGLKSATFGPAGGMTFPAVLERNESGLSELLRPTKPGISSFDSAILEEESPIKAQVANRAALDFEPYREQENEDQKSPGYPDGPIAIYGDNVYLYLEPTAEEASRFDVVINVAREVVNPFTGSPSLNEPPKLLRDADNDITLPDRSEEHTPTTPKANAHMQQPEYIHMPWDHNTDIAVDLMMLCEMIEKRTKEGKKVLVHCQQGASRSASLIIAYGLYQNPELTVNDAYYAAQAKSRWISPNMRLMYCLQDFQKEVSKKKLPGSAYKTRSGRSPTKHHRLTLSADNIDLAPKEPLTAPLPGDEANSSDSSDTSPTRPRGQSTPNRGEPISPGPSSAPSSFSWTEKEDDKDPGKFGRFNVDGLLSPYQENNRHESLPKPPPSPGFLQLKSIEVQPSFSPSSSSGFVPLQLNLPPASPGFGSFDSILKPPPSPGFGAHRFGNGTSLAFGSLNIESSSSPEPKEAVPTVDLPLRERQVAITRAEPDDAALMSPRAETMTNNPLHRLACAEFAGMHFVEVPPTPSEGLFSPRQTMFPRNPFLPFGRPPQNADPRSPPTKGETPIVRSIDEML